MLPIIRRFHCAERSADDLFSSCVYDIVFPFMAYQIAQARGSGLRSLIISRRFTSLQKSKDFFPDNCLTGNP